MMIVGWIMSDIISYEYFILFPVEELQFDGRLPDD